MTAAASGVASATAEAVPEAGRLAGAAAWLALQRCLTAGRGAAPPRFANPAFDRLARALGDASAPPTPMDLAVLVRHALRCESVQPHAAGRARLRVPRGGGWPTGAQWERAGVRGGSAEGDIYVAEALPWVPDWLTDAAARGELGADGAAAGALPRRVMRPVPGDPFLKLFGDRESYQSPGQRAAVRAALTTPPGATLLVCLPTGEGKSFVFQIVAELGFGDDAGPAAGVTLVVTPTVSLALDHERAARDLGLPDAPRAYVGGAASAPRNRLLAARIEDGTQGLCFASPEAICGPLRAPLARAAESGHVRALVVDEAHLVDAWGANFRPEFQLLSGLRRDLLGAATASGSAAPRTLLLSATLTPRVVETLRSLFGQDASGTARFGVSAAAKLRPEVEYWVAPATWEADRQLRVVDALLHLPRPAVLYVTEVAHANNWFQEARRLGFGRVACVTGKSSGDQRQAAIDGWSSGALDLVVATSAFGLGIDNPHVRAVVHACVPETLDRFYQEVGRGGRDGAASLSVVIPTERDRKTAAGLNQRRLIGDELGYGRWRAMFEHPDRTLAPHLGRDVHLVRLDVAPGGDAERIDMVSARSTQWNARTLTLMAGAGLIALEGMGLEGEAAAEARPALRGPGGHADGEGAAPSTAELDGAQYSDDDEADDVRATAPPPPPPSAAAAGPVPRVRPIVQAVRVREPRHWDEAIWTAAVEPQRQALQAANRGSLSAMYRFLRLPQGAGCAADVLAPLYDVPAPPGGAGIRVARACGGCPGCRAAGRAPVDEQPPEPAHPWPAVATRRDPAATLLDANHRSVVYLPLPPAERRGQHFRRFAEGLAALVRAGVRNVIVLPGADFEVEQLRRAAARWPFFLSHRLPLHRLPPGPSIVIAPRDAELQAQQFRGPRAAGESRFYFLPEGFPDPALPGAPLSERYQGRQMALDEFLERARL